MRPETQKKPASLADNVREQLIENPDLIFDDSDIMDALASADQGGAATNIVDLRAMAMERVEGRLARLEDTHRSVVAAAYENLAGTNQVHRAVLHLLSAPDFKSFMEAINTELAATLRVNKAVLVLETEGEKEEKALGQLHETLITAESGFVDAYASHGRGGAIRKVTLRQTATTERSIYGDEADYMRSEALIRVDLGEGRLPALLALGAEDPHMFRSSQGTDLLLFFAECFEQMMRRWLG